MNTRIWDWPTRVAHGLLIALVAFSWWSAEEGMMEYHRYSGYAMLGVLVFRLYWGVCGGVTARFAHFVKGPKAIAAYLRTGESSSPSNFGHNPLGALSVVALLALLIAQVTLGLFAVDIDGLESGPLSHLVSFDTGRAMAEAHEWCFNALVGLIVLHVGAIAFYGLIKRNNLVGPMITGTRAMPKGEYPEVRASLPLVFVGVAFASLCVWLIV